jgi:cell division septation protein DedD
VALPGPFLYSVRLAIPRGLIQAPPSWPPTGVAAAEQDLLQCRRMRKTREDAAIPAIERSDSKEVGHPSGTSSVSRNLAASNSKRFETSGQQARAGLTTSYTREGASEGDMHGAEAPPFIGPITPNRSRVVLQDPAFQAIVTERFMAEPDVGLKSSQPPIQQT